jgi:RNA polymerase sigma-70 factor, ECF subfamily
MIVASVVRRLRGQKEIEISERRVAWGVYRTEGFAMVEDVSLALFASESAEVPDIASLVGQHSALLYRIAYSVVRNATEAEDIVQETFLRVVGRRDALAGIRDMRVWLIRIAWNLSLDRKRRAVPEQMDDVFAAGLAAQVEGAEERLDRAVRMRRVLEAMERLPAAERAVLQLAAIEELETVEIARILKRSEASVRGLLFRARARLRERLER